MSGRTPGRETLPATRAPRNAAVAGQTGGTPGGRRIGGGQQHTAREPRSAEAPGLRHGDATRSERHAGDGRRAVHERSGELGVCAGSERKGE